MTSLDLTLKTVDEIEAFFKANAVPAANSEVLSKMRSMCMRLGGDGYISEKAGNVIHLAGEFFSARKHNKYNGGCDRVYSDILSDLNSIRDRVGVMKRL
jgi:hypothetical protein